MCMGRHRDAFEDFAGSVDEELGDSLERLVLFGSVARGEEGDESDVDVLVVVGDEDDRDVVEDLAFEASVRHGVFMVPLVKTVDEFREKKDSLFVKEVLDSGETYV